MLFRSGPMRVCGVDGCPDGWVVATLTTLHVVGSLDDLVGQYDLVGIDMPIGMSMDGRRQCDTEARKRLKKRACTVFPVPPRPLVHLLDYATANAESKQRFGRGIPRQSFAIWPKIRELDLLARSHPSLFVEVHPECSFAKMTGEIPPTKHREPGKNFRRRAVAEHFGSVPPSPRGAKDDDVLDAYAVLWSALRVAAGCFDPLGDGAVDSAGLLMRIAV